MYFHILKMSLRALQDNKTRSVLTALGVIVGTAIVIIVLSVGAGVRGLILHQLSSITPETLWIEVQIPLKGTRAEKDAATGQAISSGVQIKTLKIDDLDDLKKIPNIEDGYAVVIGQEKFTYHSEEKRAIYWGVSPQYQKMENLKMSSGRFFSMKDDNSLSKMVVLGKDIKETLFGNQEAVGKKIKIKGQSFTVIGVAEQVGTKYFMDMDEMVYIPVQTAQKKILGQDHLQGISLKMKNKDLLPTTKSQIERSLRRNHHIDDPEKDDFVVRTLDESMEIIDMVTDAISILLFALASISLVVGGIGIMNVMYVAVTDRTQEIGLKKAIGASPFAIRFQFLSESVVICTIGGILGIGLGISISWLVSFIAGHLQYYWPFILPTSSVLLAFWISVGIGIVFGYAPANKGSKLNPIEALQKT